MKNNNYIIVGLDPGTTSGLAVLNLKGNVRRLESRKEFSTEDIIESIIEEGDPILMATDKDKIPSGVEEVSTNFNAKTFAPEEDLPLRKKKELTSDYDPENLHERDALASALYAFNDYQNMFRSIESRADDLNLPDLAPEIKKLVVTGEADNISEAVEILLKGEEEKKDKKKSRMEEKISKEDLEDKIENYRRNLLKERKDKGKLKEHNKRLKERIKELESEKEQLSEELNELESGKRDEILKEEEIEKRERRLQSKENQVRKLQSETEDQEEKIQRLETFEKLRKRGKIPLRKVKGLTEESLRKIDRNLSLKDSVVAVEKVQNELEKTADLLEELKIKALVGNFSEEFGDELISRGIWVLSQDETQIKERNGKKYIDIESLEKAKKADKRGFLGWLKRYRERKSQK